MPHVTEPMSIRVNILNTVVKLMWLNQQSPNGIKENEVLVDNTMDYSGACMKPLMKKMSIYRIPCAAHLQTPRMEEIPSVAAREAVDKAANCNSYSHSCAELKVMNELVIYHNSGGLGLPTCSKCSYSPKKNSGCQVINVPIQDGQSRMERSQEQ